MTPDQIKPGHTYETKSGFDWLVESIDDGTVRSSFGKMKAEDTIASFAAYAVRDITPAPESHQGEKVAQAQSQGGCGGDGVNAELLAACKAALPWVATAMAYRPDAHPDAVSNHDADLKRLLAVIARAEGKS